MKQTKGEWKVVLDEEFSNEYQAGKKTRRYSIHSNNLLLATVWAEDEFIAIAKKTPVQAEQDGNAYIMAAAPDLLDVCKELFDLLEDKSPVWFSIKHYNRACSAIAKATMTTLQPV